MRVPSPAKTAWIEGESQLPCEPRRDPVCLIESACAKAMGMNRNTGYEVEGAGKLVGKLVAQSIHQRVEGPKDRNRRAEDTGCVLEAWHPTPYVRFVSKQNMAPMERASIC